jgi:hypothetical protein
VSIDVPPGVSFPLTCTAKCPSAADDIIDINIVVARGRPGAYALALAPKRLARWWTQKALPNNDSMRAKRITGRAVPCA